MLASAIFLLASEPALGPTLPPGANAAFQRAAILVEERLYASDWAGATRAARLLPDYDVVVKWDDANVPPARRAEFRAARDKALEAWRQALQAKLSLGVRKPDIVFTFEPALPPAPGKPLPQGAVLFFSDDPAQPRIEAVIGLTRGNPSAPIHPANVANEVGHAIGQLFGLDTALTTGSIMSRTDADQRREFRLGPIDLSLGTKLQVAARKLQEAVRKRERLTPTRPKGFFDPRQLSLAGLQGDRPEFVLQVSNSGNSDLAFRLTPDCGCVLSERSGYVGAGQTKLVRGQVDTTNMSGELQHSLTVETNDAEALRFEIPMRLKVKPSYRLLMPEGRTALFEEGTANLVAYFIVPELSDVKPTSVRLNGLQGTVELKPWTGKLADPELNEPEKERTGYKIAISVNGNVPKGRYPSSLVIQTSSQKIPKIARTIYVQNGIVAQPEQVYLGEVAKTPRQQSFVLSRPGKPFRVVSVASDLPSLRATYKAIRPGEVRVDVRYDGRADAGILAGEITITTDDGEQPTIVVPVRGIVR